MALSVALSLYLTRGGTFVEDEVVYFITNHGFNVRGLLSPHNGHLIFVPRLIYATSLSLFGTSYLPLRLIESLCVALAAGLFYVLAKRRVRQPVALGLTLPLLFLGSAPDVTLIPLGITHVVCIVPALGALVAYERDDRLGDVLACVLLTVAVASFSEGLPFIAGVGAAVVLRADRRARAWIFLVPLVLWLAWLIGKPGLTGPEYFSVQGLKASNVLLVPNFALNAAGAALASVLGLSYDYLRPSPVGALSNTAWVPALALLGLAALGYRLYRRRVSTLLLVPLLALLAYWVSGALVAEALRTPTQTRYVYLAVVLILLVAAEALRDVRWSRWSSLVAGGLLVTALATNIEEMRSSSATFREDAQGVRARITAVELARDRVPADFPVPLQPLSSPPAGTLLAALDRNGSFGYSPSELAVQSEAVREAADSALVTDEGLALVVTSRPPGSCTTKRATAGAPLDFPVSPPGVVLRSNRAQEVLVRRFGSAAIATLGSLAPQQSATLRIPRDASAQQWHVLIPSGGPVTVCALRGPS